MCTKVTVQEKQDTRRCHLCLHFHCADRRN